MSELIFLEVSFIPLSLQKKHLKLGTWKMQNQE